MTAATDLTLEDLPHHPRADLDLPGTAGRVLLARAITRAVEDVQRGAEGGRIDDPEAVGRRLARLALRTGQAGEDGDADDAVDRRTWVRVWRQRGDWRVSAARTLVECL